MSPTIASPLTGSTAVTVVERIEMPLFLRLVREQLTEADDLFAGVDELLYCKCGDTGVHFFHPMVTGDARFYETITESGVYNYFLDKEEYSIAAAFIRPGDRVLDVGCGIGRFARRLPEGTSFRGLEFSPPALAVGRGEGLDLVDEAIEAHAAANGESYDAVVSFQVLEHVSDPRGFLEAMVACTRPDGRVIIGVPDESGAMGFAVNGAMNMPPHHVTRWDEASLRRALELVGLIDIVVQQDRLAPDLRSWYAENLVVRMLLNARDRRLPLVTGSLRYKVAQRIARIVAPFVTRALPAGPHEIAGQTIVACGRKPRARV